MPENSAILRLALNALNRVRLFNSPGGEVADAWSGDAISTRAICDQEIARLQAPLDGCDICKGVRGGVPGNENIQHGKTVCDFCSADIIRIERAVRDQTLLAAIKIASMASTAEDAAWEEKASASQIVDALNSVRLTPDGRWQDESAMALWQKVTA